MLSQILNQDTIKNIFMIVTIAAVLKGIYNGISFFISGNNSEESNPEKELENVLKDLTSRKTENVILKNLNKEKTYAYTLGTPLFGTYNKPPELENLVDKWEKENTSIFLLNEKDHGFPLSNYIFTEGSILDLKNKVITKILFEKKPNK